MNRGPPHVTTWPLAVLEQSVTSRSSHPVAHGIPYCIPYEFHGYALFDDLSTPKSRSVRRPACTAEHGHTRSSDGWPQDIPHQLRVFRTISMGAAGDSRSR